MATETIIPAEKGSKPLNITVVAHEPRISSNERPSSTSVSSIRIIDTRLATYGTLQPGAPNHHKLSHLKGTWKQGTVYGHLVHSGWGAEMGFPAWRKDVNGPALRLWVLESDELVNEWEKMDTFEGEGYERVVVDVDLDEGRKVEAWIYALAAQTESTAA